MTEKREDDHGEHEYTLSKTCVYCGHWESLSPLYDMVKREVLDFLVNDVPNALTAEEELENFKRIEKIKEVLGIE